MIERETITDETTTRIILRFVRERTVYRVRKGVKTQHVRRTVRYATCRVLGEHWRGDKRVEKREWGLHRDIDLAHAFKDVSWARRFSKIVDIFKDYTHGRVPGWKVQVVELREHTLETREIKQLHPIADAIEALADLGRAVTGPG